MKKVPYWSLDRLALMIVSMLTNKFDCFIVIEGQRGLGKSTLAIHLSKRVAKLFKKIAKETGDEKSPFHDAHKFSMGLQVKYPKKHKYVIYTREDVIKFYNEWHKTAIADEMVNVAFNREFWNDDQKNLIKIINMNRDHCNLFIACVPQFQVLDNQIKNLCKIRITVARRGLAVLQTPNRTIYNKDKWDTANNERIEREWLKKGSGLPQYSKLNTFRGMVKFRALKQKDQKLYDDIKVSERTVIAKDQFGIKGEEQEKKTPLQKVVELLVTNGVKNMQVIDGFAMAAEVNEKAFKERVRQELIKLNKPHQLNLYFWDKKARNIPDEEAAIPIANTRFSSVK